MRTQAELRGDRITLTAHAGARMRQRGFKEQDLNLIREVGERVEDGYLMSNRAVEARIHALRRQIIRLEHLRGAPLIEADSVVVTVYRPDKDRVRRLREDKVGRRS